jgi:predicted O-methyltransferase YrrM
MNRIREDRRLAALLDRLHAASAAQEAETAGYLAGAGARSTIGDEADWQAGRAFWRDKLVALDRDKAELCYLLCRAAGARRVLEAGTSFGVSTLYLAAAVLDNGGGTVIATEFEPEKAAVAARHFEQAGVAGAVDLRVGDVRETIRPDDGPIDVLLLDIWVPMVRPVLERAAPLMPVGAFVVADNTASRREAYGEMFAYFADRANGFTTTTLPFAGGLELAVRTG